MQKSRLLSVVLVALLVVAGVGCTTLRDGYGDEYETSTSAADRIYVDDPYRGTIVLERDPFTGRYYQVGTYGSSRNSIYDPYYRNDVRYNPYYRNGGGRYYRDNRTYNPNIRQTPAQTPAQREKTRQTTRERILGEKS